MSFLEWAGRAGRARGAGSVRAVALSGGEAGGRELAWEYY